MPTTVARIIMSTKRGDAALEPLPTSSPAAPAKAATILPDLPTVSSLSTRSTLPGIFRSASITSRNSSSKMAVLDTDICNRNRYDKRLRTNTSSSFPLTHSNSLYIRMYYRDRPGIPTGCSNLH